MNTITVYDDKIKTSQIDSNIEAKFISKKDENYLQVKIKENANLSIRYEIHKNHPLWVEIEVLKDVQFSLEEIKTGKQNCVHYVYHLLENSEVHISKLYKVEQIEEKDIAYLEGEGARLFFHLHTLSIDEEMYDIKVYHKAAHTNCYIDNKAVTDQSGEVKFHVINKVEKGVKGCFIDQKSRVVTLNLKKSVIQPILLIDEYEVEASHSAHIGTFDQDILFYLESRGIPYKKAVYMLIKGFLMEGKSQSTEVLETFMNEYWG